MLALRDQLGHSVRGQHSSQSPGTMTGSCSSIKVCSQAMISSSQALTSDCCADVRAFMIPSTVAVI